MNELLFLAGVAAGIGIGVPVLTKVWQVEGVSDMARHVFSGR